MSASLAFHAFLPRELVQSDHEKQPPIVRFWSCELGPKARYDRAARNLWTQGGTTAKVWVFSLWVLCVSSPKVPVSIDFAKPEKELEN